jgi:hypothetical protein
MKKNRGEDKSFSPQRRRECGETEKKEHGGEKDRPIFLLERKIPGENDLREYARSNRFVFRRF